MTKPSEQQTGISIERGRWLLEWDSEDSNEYILHDADGEREFKLTYEEMRDLRFVLGAVAEVRARDLIVRNGNTPKEKE